MSTSGSALRADRLSIGYHGRVVLGGIDMDLQAGELVALIGANGIGKSTLLRTLAGLLQAMDGSVSVGGEEIRTMSANRRARSVSIVLTGRAPASMLDVRTVVALGRQPWTNAWGTLRDEDRTAVDHALERCDATHLRSRQLNTCSDGEYQKVLIARALAQSTPMMLLDEPTAFLDLPNRAAIVRMLRGITRSEHKAILFSTHDLQLAMDLCDRIVLLRATTAPWQGAPAEALSSGELERAFSGTGIRFDAAAGTHRFVL